MSCSISAVGGDTVDQLMFIVKPGSSWRVSRLTDQRREFTDLIRGALIEPLP